MRQCDPELAAGGSIPQVHCPTLPHHPPPSPPPSGPLLSPPRRPPLFPTTSPLVFPLSPLIRAEGGGGTIKPQDAFREDPVTRAQALSSALTKSATEREETRPLRESLFVVRRGSTLDRYFDILPPCLCTCPRRSAEYFSSSLARSPSPVFTTISRKRDPRRPLALLPRLFFFLDFAQRFFPLSLPAPLSPSSFSLSLSPTIYCRRLVNT